CLDLAIFPDTNAVCKSNAARVWYTENATLGGVAGGACIKKVRIFQIPMCISCNRYKMLDVERGSPVVPSLSVQAIDAPEHELVPYPVAVTLVILITTRPVAPNMGLGWILESLHHTPFFRMVADPKTRSSSSSRTCVGRGDTFSK